ncbi:hypothetical protein EN828_06410 [Mesorhizobium sp. M2D.F.Ca.ET.185.01.1.1]|uniref:DUF5330 domain-containing protein n=1 Tax=unclassified Mesorhizobium TaxID=325217 RepID=UPI000FCCA8AB|nr:MULTISPECIES: DUF5330 domain-containing protein [unclassified Mesorhizobium]TGP76319.1 hypothetical protein EN870_22210 [bacterium M00.F.Ca.ET.227.01.1.1]TGP92373.1 hypothetical protein EN865_20645 [bacterium M00.F.Ca.ET.222.01.1.1]TGP96928.1 hypothetical protein EN864_10925 [bacterium M00.F.Ca.ET.221.01.1.1]TGU06611.1 hypothetical protein EN806_34915 [bacterium M00.F.Ca.ET.163.01.1.1]TGU27761.1 hypothetical protein EN799_39585 [bacterium M00.F.Ca.ET.156.01.1.1]TGU50139.1 hypothetical prot
MGFLIRMAFWFSLVLLALPFGVGPGEDGQQSVGPIQALFAAREAVGDIAGLCERKPDVCETGKSAMYTITVRAKETAKIAAAMIDDQQSGQAAAPETKVADGSVTTTGSVAEDIVLPAKVNIPVMLTVKN